jgi:hypothetical protein
MRKTLCNVYSLLNYAALSTEIKQPKYVNSSVIVITQNKPSSVCEQDRLGINIIWNS